MNRQLYNIIDLRTGKKWLCPYNRFEALYVAHELNKKNPNERYAICAV